MKRLTILCFFAGLMVAFASVSKAHGSDTVKLKVLSWNIQMLPTTFDVFSESLRKLQHVRVDWIVEHCSESDYDIIVFQEVFDVQMKNKIKKHLKSLYPYHINTRSKSGRLTSNGVLIVSRVPIKYVDHVIYPRGVYADAWASKGCTLIEGEKDGKNFQLAATHLQAGGSPEAMAQRSIQNNDIVHLLERHKIENVPVFVAGDMNIRSTGSDEYFEMLHILGVSDFPVNDESPYTIDNNNSWNVNAQAKRLDYILMHARTTATRIFNQYILRLKKEYKGKPTDYSDHYGIVAEIELFN